MSLASMTVALSAAQAEQRETEMAKDLDLRNIRFELESAQRDATEASSAKTCARACVHVCMYVRACVCMCVCM